MTKDWYPVIDYSRCAACMTCVKFCPHGVFDAKDEKPLVLNPESCIDMCRGCAKICPEKAITHHSSSK